MDSGADSPFAFTPVARMASVPNAFGRTQLLDLSRRHARCLRCCLQHPRSCRTRRSNRPSLPLVCSSSMKWGSAAVGGPIPQRTGPRRPAGHGSRTRGDASVPSRSTSPLAHEEVNRRSGSGGVRARSAYDLQNAKHAQRDANQPPQGRSSRQRRHKKGDSGDHTHGGVHNGPPT